MPEFEGGAAAVLTHVGFTGMSGRGAAAVLVPVGFTGMSGHLNSKVSPSLLCLVLWPPLLDPWSLEDFDVDFFEEVELVFLVGWAAEDLPLLEGLALSPRSVSWPGSSILI